MINFQDNNILTGYIKELLVSFNLPTPKIYTKNTKLYKGGIYIKDNNIVKCEDPDKKTFTIMCPYQYNVPELYYTKNLKINSLIYDSHTHEYLGDYLRFIRDYNKLDLMSLYNCFSDNLVNNLDINKSIIEVSDKNDIKITNFNELVQGLWYNYSNFNPLENIEGIQVIEIQVSNITNIFPKNTTQITTLENYNSLNSKIIWNYASQTPSCTIYDVKTSKQYSNFEGEFDFVFDSYNLVAGEIYNEADFLKYIYKAFNSSISFSTDEDNYKIYMIPVKFFKEYTIAINSDYPYELICGFYTKGLLEEEDSNLLDIIQNKTYQYIPTSNFNTPFVYNKLLDENFFSNSFYQEHEESLKLFLKMPITNNSSIVILEGNYLNWNDRLIYKSFYTEGLDLNKTLDFEDDHVLALLGDSYVDNDSIIAEEELEVSELDNSLDSVDKLTPVDYFFAGPNKDIKVYVVYYDGKYIEFTDVDENDVPIPLKTCYDNGTRDVWKNNVSIINFKENLKKYDEENNYFTLDVKNNHLEDVKLVSSLQLLNINSSTSHPFADRLIEYLLDNAVTHLDNISDNITRLQEALYRRYYSDVKKVVDPETGKTITISNKAGLKNITYRGKWDNLYKAINYDVSKETGLLNTACDLLGYMDKDVEKELGKDVNIYEKEQEVPKAWQ